MTHEELDVMWSIATRKSIEESQPYTRYEFAKMVAAKEREACAALVEREWSTNQEKALCDELASYIRARGEA